MSAKKDILDFLEMKKIHYELTEHRAAFDMADLAAIPLPYPESMAKNLFLQDPPGHNYYLVTVIGHKRVNLKAFKENHGLRRLSMAPPQALMAFLGLTPGSVGPFGLLNDKACRVHFYLDRDFKGNRIGLHPNDNRATVWMMADDLVRILEEEGHEIQWTEIDE